MDVKDIFELIQSALTSAAILTAGIWALFHYLKGRTYQPSIELQVKGRLLETDGRKLLVGCVTVENVGRSNFQIAQTGTGLRVLSYPSSWPSDSEPFFAMLPEHLGTVPIFEERESLEPRESASEEWMFAVPTPAGAFRLDARVLSGEKPWTSSAIIGVEPKREA